LNFKFYYRQLIHITITCSSKPAV